MSTLATLKVNLIGDIKGFADSMKQAEAQTRSTVGNIGNALGTIGKVAAGAAVAGVAAVGPDLSLTVGASFRNRSAGSSVPRAPWRW